MADHSTERVNDGWLDCRPAGPSLRVSLFSQHPPRQCEEFVPNPCRRVEPALVSGLIQFLTLLLREPDAEDVSSSLLVGFFGSSGHDTIVATKNLGRKRQLALTGSVRPNTVALV